MGDLLDLDALSSLPDRHVVALGEAVRNAGYDAQLLAETEAIAPRQFDALRLPLVQAALAERSGAAAVLARLFGYRDALGRDGVSRALGPDLATALVHCGALVQDGERIRSRLRLLPFGGVWVGSDDADARFDPVMGPGATTAQLLRAMPTAMPARVLDVGTGAGSLALAAAHAGATSVTAVDLDPRAVALTRWNARLNALNVTALQGDLLEPVRGQTFDLIVAQPPFVPQPPEVEATTYLHGGARGDELALRLLAALPDALAPGGRAVVMMDSAPEGTALDRIRAALPDVPVQLSVVDSPGHNAHNLAVGYAAAADSTLGPIYADTARRYASHLAALGIDRVRHLLVVLRRPHPGDATWAVSVEPRDAVPYDAAALQRLDSALAVATLAPRDLRTRHLAPPEGTRLVQVHPLDDSAAAELRFVCPTGRAPDQSISDAAARLLEIAAQTDTVAALIDSYAELCNDSSEAVESAVLGFLRKALVSGMLEPSDLQGPS
jgi:HemK-related putative methylase